MTRYLSMIQKFVSVGFFWCVSALLCHAFAHMTADVPAFRGVLVQILARGAALCAPSLIRLRIQASTMTRRSEDLQHVPASPVSKLSAFTPISFFLGYLDFCLSCIPLSSPPPPHRLLKSTMHLVLFGTILALGANAQSSFTYASAPASVSADRHAQQRPTLRVVWYVSSLPPSGTGSPFVSEREKWCADE
ncbi:hypothetical protein DFH06DRAFT_1478044 [Mycena polygramma]|nr:hypothetical protein DFH06DRAFT_1478044 [Mycena polygramma]